MEHDRVFSLFLGPIEEQLDFEDDLGQFFGPVEKPNCEGTITEELDPLDELIAESAKLKKPPIHDKLAILVHN